MRKYLFFALLLVVNWGYAQEPDTIQTIKVKKNVIQGSVGTIYFFSGAQLNYERQLIQFEENTVSGLWANVGIGAWGVIHASGPFQHLSASLLSGNNNNHFELTFGLSRYKTNVSTPIDGGFSNPQPNKPSNADFTPIGSMGYRFQKPGGGFVFRCGIAYPPTPYIGIGASF